RDAMQTDVVHERGASDGGHVEVREAPFDRGPGREVSNSARVTGAWRGPQVSEVGNRLERGIELMLSEALLQRRFAIDEGAPIGFVVRIAEHLVGEVA